MMAASCCKSLSQLVVETNHVEWMKNLPSELHDEPITKIAIPGTHDSFAFQLSHHPGPDLDANLKRIHFLISPIIKNWSITQNLTFTGSWFFLSLEEIFLFYLNRTIIYWYSLF